MSPIELEASGPHRLGTADPPARRVHDGDGPLAPILLLAAVATMGVAAWLFAVTATVLPARDPAHIPMWRWIAITFLAYGGLSLAFLYTRRRHPILRAILLFISAAAVGAGLYGIVSMVRSANRGGQFEGYIVLMGLILCCHGVTGILLAWKSWRVAHWARSN